MFDNITEDVVTDIFFNITSNIDELGEVGELYSLIADFVNQEYKIAID